MTKVIEYKGFDELERRFSAYPMEYYQVMVKTVGASLLTLQENIPPYPPKPTNSNYRRTGTLGRSLGVAETGGRIGMPQIYSVKRAGSGMGITGRLGTRLHYASRVIGARGQQSAFFAQYWWQLEQTIGKAYGKILGLFKTAASSLASFLEGKGIR